jgi:iron complex transport system substrate-binding protein
MHRIISLIASATEILHALGYGEQMVGRSHECDFPATVKMLPPCTEPKFDTEGTRDELSERVKEIVQEGLSVYHVKAWMLNDLKPTHIITQTQCEVCAVSLRDVQEAVCNKVDTRPMVVSLEPNSLEDIWMDIERVGTVLGATDQAQRLVETLAKRMSAVERIANYLKPVRVAFIEWMNPLMAGGNWMPELIKLAGGKNLFGEPKKDAPNMTWEDLKAADPDVIIVAPCGFDIARTLEEMPVFASNPGFEDLNAVIYENVFVADGNHFFNRPGPRIADTLEMIAEMLHPESFDFGHEGKGWVRYAPVEAT